MGLSAILRRARKIYNQLSINSDYQSYLLNQSENKNPADVFTSRPRFHVSCCKGEPKARDSLGARRRVQIIRVPEEAEGQQSIYRARLSLTFVSSDQLVLATLEYRIHFEIALKGGRAILSYDQHHKRPSYQAPTVSRISAL